MEKMVKYLRRKKFENFPSHFLAEIHSLRGEDADDNAIMVIIVHENNLYSLEL